MQDRAHRARKAAPRSQTTYYKHTQRMRSENQYTCGLFRTWERGRSERCHWFATCCGRQTDTAWDTRMSARSDRLSGPVVYHHFCPPHCNQSTRTELFSLFSTSSCSLTAYPHSATWQREFDGSIRIPVMRSASSWISPSRTRAYPPEASRLDSVLCARVRGLSSEAEFNSDLRPG